MQASSFNLLTSLAFFVALSLQTSAAPSTISPTLGQIFTATIELGRALSPIPIAGGERDVEPITGGTIQGCAINATVAGGLAYPSVVNNGTVEIPQIILYGTTIPDKVSFLIQLTGVGSTTGQLTQAQIEIGGRYAPLADAFILASLDPNANHTVVTVQGFEVQGN